MCLSPSFGVESKRGSNVPVSLDGWEHSEVRATPGGIGRRPLVRLPKARATRGQAVGEEEDASDRRG